VYATLEGVLDRVLEMFPSRYVHVGGDECPKDRWKQCGRCQERKRREGLADEDELQSYFIWRIGSFLRSRGRVLVGWDEILQGGLAPGAVVMSWRGMQGGVAAARQGHDVVMSPSNPCYLNMRQAEHPAEPGVLRAGAPIVNLESVYRWDPVSPELDENAASHVIGGQACMWTERVSEEAVVEYLLQPRLAALAEVLWSRPENRSWDGFVDRMSAQGAVLSAVGWEHRRSPEPAGSERAPG
jgi:hexosaminidase